jgi:hypothetical protein
MARFSCLTDKGKTPMKDFILFLFVFILGYLCAIAEFERLPDLKIFQREKWFHG